MASLVYCKGCRDTVGCSRFEKFINQRIDPKGLRHRCEMPSHNNGQRSIGEPFSHQAGMGCGNDIRLFYGQPVEDLGGIGGEKTVAQFSTTQRGIAVAAGIRQHDLSSGVDQAGNLRKPAEPAAQPAMQQQYRRTAAVTDIVDVGVSDPDLSSGDTGGRGETPDQVTHKINGNSSQIYGPNENADRCDAGNHKDSASVNDVFHNRVGSAGILIVNFFQGGHFGKQFDLDLLDFGQTLPLARQQMVDFFMQVPNLQFGLEVNPVVMLGPQAIL